MAAAVLAASRRGAVDRGGASSASDLGICRQAGFEPVQRRGTSVGGQSGTAGLGAALQISLWVYGYSEGVNSGRAIEELCEWEAGYQWLTGAQVVNAHTLTDFRVKHDKALHELLVQVLGLLSADGLITLQRVMQDGTKIRAQAAGDSFRSKERVEQALKQAREQVEAVGALSEEETSRRMVKA